MKCPVCFHHCDLSRGQIGLCRARIGGASKVVSLNYGRCTSLALDPIEKKPLKEFCPGSMILSYGSFGCNLHCPFCQNYEISQNNLLTDSEYVSPQSLVESALSLVPQGNIGLAFTYNEPLVSYEYVKDAAKLAKENGLRTVLVTNGTATLEVLKEILPYIDAMNIDLKAFDESFYKYVGGSLEMVKAFIASAYKKCHIELTTLIIPGKNDSPEAMKEEAKWIASLDPKIPLHLSRYFPRYEETEPMTPLSSLTSLKAIAKRYLNSVYLGNV